MKKVIAILIIVLGALSIIFGIGSMTMSSNISFGSTHESRYDTVTTPYRYYGEDGTNAYSGIQQAAADAANHAADAAKHAADAAENAIMVELAVRSASGSICFSIGAVLIVIGGIIVLYGVNSLLQNKKAVVAAQPNTVPVSNSQNYYNSAPITAHPLERSEPSSQFEYNSVSAAEPQPECPEPCTEFNEESVPSDRCEVLFERRSGESTLLLEIDGQAPIEVQANDNFSTELSFGMHQLVLSKGEKKTRYDFELTHPITLGLGIQAGRPIIEE